jgi:DeoR/GlpR family transcriptional regulator of sugar metabolism
MTSRGGVELPVQRRSHILQRINDLGAVRTQDLSEELRVSVETIRRDLGQLEAEGLLERVHGGAAIPGQRQYREATFTDRSVHATTQKLSIGTAAAALVRDGNTVFIDVGTTAVHLAQALPISFSGLVATNSLPVAAELASRPAVEVLIGGGLVRTGDLAVSGPLTVQQFSDLRADIAFLSSGGVEPVSGLTDFNRDEVAVKRALIANSARAYVLADSSKFNRIAPYHVAGWDTLSGLIVDQNPPAGLRRAVTEVGGEIVVAAPIAAEGGDPE